MNEKKSCSIYSIYGWMGVVGKYTGCFPLPGLYEKREWSKCTKGFINYVIPALNLCFLITFYVTFCAVYKLRNNKDLTDILLVLRDGCIFAHFFLCIALNHFRLSPKLASYLKMHVKVNQLLKNNRPKIKRFISIFFAITMIYSAIQRAFVSYDNSWKQLFPLTTPVQLLFNVCNRLTIGFIFSLALGTHPHLMYIVFQYVLKSSFDELGEKIKKNEKLSGEMRVKKMRKYMRLYGDLCDISVRLDAMVAPLMLVRFMQHYVGEIYAITLFMHSFSEFSLPSGASMVMGFFVLIVVPNSAHLTKKSQNKILPAIYSVFNSNEKDVEAELEKFALQSMYLNASFSVSGFVKLDRKLILTIFQSLFSQVIVFYKIRKENVFKPRYE